MEFQNSRISCSTFASYSSPNNGGCISISNAKIPIEIENCNFINTSSSLEGGAIYLFSSPTNLTFNSFYGCASNCKTNNKYGNAMLSRQSVSNFNESSCYSCSIDFTMYSDSCLSSHYEKFISIFSNGTYNHGRGRWIHFYL